MRCFAVLTTMATTTPAAARCTPSSVMMVRMAPGSSFKRRERGADPPAAGRSVYRGDDLESAVAEHLARLLNTRQGSSLTAPDYGIIELSELLHDFPDAEGIMQRCIKNTVSTYEPRLTNVAVRVIEPEEYEGEVLVHFEITGQLSYPGGDRQPFRLATVVDQSSNVRLG